MSAKKAEATYHGADIVTRLRAQAPYSDDGQAMTEAAEEIEKLREGFEELAAIAREWDAESGRAESYSRTQANTEQARKLSMQRAMLLHHHAAAVEGCIERAKP